MDLRCPDPQCESEGWSEMDVSDVFAKPTGVLACRFLMSNIMCVRGERWGGFVLILVPKGWYVRMAMAIS